MKKVSKIANNALKILEYLIENNVMLGRQVKVHDLFDSVGLERAEFESADSYLLQKKYVDGTIGGMNGSRWLTGDGIDYYEENSSLIDFESDKQGEGHMPDSKMVFVVHGRDGRIRSEFFSFLRALGLHPMEWSEALKLTGKATPYIGEVLESAFSNAQAVIVLLTPDDEVRLSPDLWNEGEHESEKTMVLQARPNVLFEAGMAFGTHTHRTLLVEVGQVKAFSDVAGRHVVRLSGSADSRNAIAERLETAGCDVSKSGSDWLNAGDFTIQRKANIGGDGYKPEDLAEGDIIALLEGWWQESCDMRQTYPDDIRVEFRAVDQLLKLPLGSTKQYIFQVASRNSFKLVSSGNVVAVFTYDISDAW